MAAYCSTDDLLMGEIPIPAYIDSQKIVDDAADEIDSKIGYRYNTPVNIGVGTPVVRPAVLLLKRINAHLATGRLLLQLASPAEQPKVHAYGLYLVQESQRALDSIVSGEIILDGAVGLPGADTEPATAPMISNLDAESNVEAFYDRISNPNYFYPPVWGGYVNPDGFIR